MSLTAEILSVGTEILLGNITNTNATFLSQELSVLGINVYHHTVVGDNPQRLAEAMDIALGRNDLIITTGGLGPTYDDLTKQTVGRALGLEMELHEDILADLKARWERRGTVMPPNNEQQAWFPKGCTIIPNDWGTAPSCAIEKEGKTVIMLPGPPYEMKNIWNRYVAPMMQAWQDSVLVSRYCRVVNIGESALEERLSALLKNSLNPTIAPYAGGGETVLRVTAKAATREEAYALTVPAVEHIARECGDDLYAVDKDSMEQVVCELLRELGLRVATCESITGGGLARRITDVPGASDVFECGLVTYSDRMKYRLADVSLETLRAHSAISLEAAIEMAEGTLKQSGADLAVSVTGVAGPETLPQGEPGTVYAAVAGPLGTRAAKLTLLRSNDRDRNRINATGKALDYLRFYLLDLQRSKRG
ncbi:MAG: competence/damage-inducible protein A [Clostridiales bacterium]|nr:competence/damage-inducible protein A [Clostridiales bacterium]